MCAKASPSMFALVLTVDALEGDNSSSGLAATTRWVSGVSNVAFVPSGTASRLIRGAAVLLRGTDIKPIAAGVGVAGGRIGLLVFFLLGVEGSASLLFVMGSLLSCGTLFLFLLVLAAFGGAGPFVSSFFMDEAALNRVDLLEDIVKLFRKRLFLAEIVAIDLKGEGGRDRSGKILNAVFDDLWKVRL